MYDCNTVHTKREMTIIQAVLIASLYWLASGEIYVPFTYCFCDLMLISLLTGTILGDPVKGCIVGGTIQPLYLALTAVGGAMPVDKEAAGIVTTTMVITQGISLDQGLVVSSAAALILAQLHTVRRVAMVWTVHHADAAAAKGNIAELRRTSLIYGPVTRFVIMFIPMFLLVMYGVQGLGFLMNGLPEWANNMFGLAGGMMPALGFAMTIMVVGKGELIPFFIVGFFFAKYTGLGSIPGCLLGVFLGWLWVKFTSKDSGSIFGDLKGLAKADSGQEHILSKKTLNRVWRDWRLNICNVDNVERLQALGMCLAMAPALEELYPDDKEEQIAGLERHMEFFITENLIGGIIPGVVVSLEEQRAIQKRNGVEEDECISPELINSVKTGMMGPFAGIGDTLNYATIKPLITTLFMGFAQQGMIWAPIVDDIILYTVLCLEGRFMYNIGYRLGTGAATSILQNNSIQKIISLFSIVGLFVMGVMASENVSVALNVMMPYGQEAISLQETLIDAIAPGLLPLLTVFGVYTYMKKGKGANILKATLILLAIAIVFGGLGILTA